MADSFRIAFLSQLAKRDIRLQILLIDHFTKIYTSLPQGEKRSRYTKAVFHLKDDLLSY